jgi:cytochrome c oxidase subunit IV
VDFPVSVVVFVLTEAISDLPATAFKNYERYMSDQPSHSHGPIVEAHGSHPIPGHDPHHAAGEHGHGDSHAGHHGGIAIYIYVFIALCFLTTLSFLTYSHWWRANFSNAESRLLMMAVSCTKALLVILCFMHIWWEASWKFVLTIPAALMSVFLILMLVPDVGMRLHRASEERKFNQAEERVEQTTTPDTTKHPVDAHPAGAQPAAEPAS